MIRRLEHGAAGGDLNSIISLNDSNKNPESRISPSCRNLVKALEWSDSYRELYPRTTQYSRHMTHTNHGHGASRLDRAYHWGEIKVNQAEYLSISFSDHLSLVTQYNLPKSLQRHLAPMSKTAFKISPSVVKDDLFNIRLKTSMQEWTRVLDTGVEVLTWWEILVKKGIKQLAITRSKEIKKQTIGRLNILKLRQANLTHKVNTGQIEFLAELKTVNILISEWYIAESNKIILLSRSNDVNLNEKVRVYHHGQHQQFRKRSSILQLQTPKGIVSGHNDCAEALETNVFNHLTNTADLHHLSQDVLLDEVEVSFTELDNENLKATPTGVEIKKVLDSCRAHAAPGTDGLTVYFYQQCWETIGGTLTKVIQSVFGGQNQPPVRGHH